MERACDVFVLRLAEKSIIIAHNIFCVCPSLIVGTVTVDLKQHRRRRLCLIKE